MVLFLLLLEVRMQKYIYEGPVTEFGRIIDNCWYGETMAVSPSKAKSNLIFRFKKQNNKTSGAKIELPGEVKERN